VPPERRTTQRNGYRPRTWDTRVGQLELATPKLRQGSYFPGFLEPRRRAEQALVAVVQEAYVNGGSTRKVDRLVAQLGLQGMGKDQVSRLCRGLDEQVRSFRERPWRAPTPTLWLDAKVELVREPGGVRHKALVIAYGVHHSGAGRSSRRGRDRELLAGVPAQLAGLRAGLRLAAPHRPLPPRHARPRRPGQQPLVSGAIRGIFTAASAAEAQQRLAQVADQLAVHAPKVARLLEDAEADLLAFYAFPAEHWSKLRSTDESFKARVALSAGWNGVSLVGGRGRPRSEEQGLGAGSPAA
jgi:putative transposase